MISQIFTNFRQNPLGFNISVPKRCQKCFQILWQCLSGQKLVKMHLLEVPKIIDKVPTWNWTKFLFSVFLWICLPHQTHDPIVFSLSVDSWSLSNCLHGFHWGKEWEVRVGFFVLLPWCLNSIWLRNRYFCWLYISRFDI